MTTIFRRRLAALFIATACLAAPASAQEVVTFKVPLQVQGFDPEAEVNVSAVCFLLGGQRQTYGIQQVWVDLTQGAYSGTVDVPVQHIAGSPKPTSWECSFAGWKIRYPWQSASTFCVLGNTGVTWPCNNGCFTGNSKTGWVNACSDIQHGDFQ